MCHLQVSRSPRLCTATQHLNCLHWTTSRDPRPLGLRAWAKRLSPTTLPSTPSEITCPTARVVCPHLRVEREGVSGGDPTTWVFLPAHLGPQNGSCLLHHDGKGWSPEDLLWHRLHTGQHMSDQRSPKVAGAIGTQHREM